MSFSRVMCRATRAGDTATLVFTGTNDHEEWSVIASIDVPVADVAEILSAIGDLRASVPSPRRLRILERDGWRCRYCGRRLNVESGTLDHLRPTARGGSDEDDNLAASCLPCNSQKGAKTEDEYRAWLAARPG